MSDDRLLDTAALAAIRALVQEDELTEAQGSLLDVLLKDRDYDYLLLDMVNALTAERDALRGIVGELAECEPAIGYESQWLSRLVGEARAALGLVSAVEG